MIRAMATTMPAMAPVPIDWELWPVETDTSGCFGPAVGDVLSVAVLFIESMGTMCGGVFWP